MFLRILVCFCAAGFFCQAGELVSPSGTKPPKVAAASDEAERAIKRFEVAPGFKVEVFAAEPHLANPVAFHVDEKGRFYVVETFRLHDGVTDIRGHMDWLDEDLANRSVDDRLAMMERHLGAKISDYQQQSERISLIEDRDGDGKADHSTVFAEGFNSIVDGLAAGVLPRKGDVYFANLPNLWLLRDKNGDGVADERRSLHYGFGVRVGFLGHDLHGLCFGPDGKVYFSIGDRGAAIKTTGRIVGDPDSGAVYRCNRDGSDLEVFAYGLRNPQELAFDQYGNLFTGDNNSDGGDKARWVYVVEGGDSGWRVGFQFIDSPNSRGPWNSEKMWYPPWKGQAAFLVPPVTNLANGPSGLTYNPGTSMPEKYKEHFWLCDFRGGRGSGIHSFAVKPKGAGFELVDRENFIWEGLPTDVDFGVEGGLYYTDWVQGWNMTGKGRIYRVYNPEAVKQPIVLETKKLIAEGMEKRSVSELSRLLAHADMRVRQEAQFELADRGVESVQALTTVARKNPSQLARLHAIWGLGQIAANYKNHQSRESRQPIQALLPLLTDPDAEVRAQAAKVLGDQRANDAVQGLINLLSDTAARPRFFAAISLGKLGRKEAFQPLVTMLRQNADEDPFLRHAGVMGLTGIADPVSLLGASKDDSAAVRMAVLLTLRRLDRADVSLFLHDADINVVQEAARAINDVPISGAMPALAMLIDDTKLPVPALRRAVNANYRFGLQSNAVALARFALAADAPDGLRAEALRDLAAWPHPSGRDNVTGLWRPTAALRDPSVPAEALQPALKPLLASAPEAVRVAAIRAATSLQIPEAGSAFFELLQSGKTESGSRVEILKALALLKDSRLNQALTLVENDDSTQVRREAVRLRAESKPSGAAAGLETALERGSVPEKQTAFASLASLEGADADKVLSTWLDQLLAGKVDKQVQLDLLEAARKRATPEIKTKVQSYEASQAKDDPLAGYRECLYGGASDEGKKIFFERAEAACVRCHKAGGEGGEVGPDLTGVGTRKDRAYILESILFPNKEIAAGFESLIVTTQKGVAYAGILKSEDGQKIVLNSPEDGLVTIPKNEIKSRERGLSAMPEGMPLILSKQDLRNLVEFLSALK